MLWELRGERVNLILTVLTLLTLNIQYCERCGETLVVPTVSIQNAGKKPALFFLELSWI